MTVTFGDMVLSRESNKWHVGWEDISALFQVQVGYEWLGFFLHLNHDKNTEKDWLENVCDHKGTRIEMVDRLTVQSSYFSTWIDCTERVERKLEIQQGTGGIALLLSSAL